MVATENLLNTISATSTTLLPPAVVCVNGGELLSGVCICPAEWTGETCSDTGTPQASARCSRHNGSLRFDTPQVQRCDLTLSGILNNLTNQADLLTLATSTQVLTSRPDQLTPDNITTAASIVNTLLQSANVTENITVAAVATISQLLNVSGPVNTEESDATQSLTLTLEQLSVNQSVSLNVMSSQVVQPNLVVQSAQIPGENTQGVQFTALTAVRREQRPSNISVGFVLYQNDRFFRSRIYRSQLGTSVRVLSGQVKGQSRSQVPQHVEMLFRPRIIPNTTLYDYTCVFWDYSLEDWSTEGCVKRNSTDGLLRCLCNHTTNFAVLMSFTENYDYLEPLSYITYTQVVCASEFFSIVYFFIFQRKGHNSSNPSILLVSVCVSLLIFIITFLSGVNNPNKHDTTQVEVTNTGSNIIPSSDLHIEPDRGPCTAVAVLLQFFLLATFVWNVLYATQLFLLIHKMQRRLPSRCTTLSLIAGWGRGLRTQTFTNCLRLRIPAVIVSVTLGVSYRVQNPLGYRQEEFCWLAGLDREGRFDFRKPMFWGFLVPQRTNLTIHYMVWVVLCKHIYNVLVQRITSLDNSLFYSTQQFSMRKKFLSSFSLAVLLGLSWILGYLALVTKGDAHLIFSIFFCLCTTTQGFQIFILFTARTSAFKKNTAKVIQHISAQIPLHSRTFTLWKNKGTDSTESYREMDPELSSHI
ncbi:adhesion G-protein coupled receptor G7-like [Polymixia lowei]